MPREPVQIVRSAVEAFAARDNDAVVRDYADDVVWDMSHYAGWPGASAYTGVDAVRDFFRDWLSSFVDWSWEPIEIVDAGDRVVVIGRDCGRVRGSSGRVKRELAQVWTVSDGRVLRITSFRTRAEALEAVRATARSDEGHSERAPQAVLHEAYEAWNRSDFELLVDLFDEDAEVRSVFARRLQGQDLYRGHAGVRAWAAAISEVIDMHVEPGRYFPYGRLVLSITTVVARPLSGGPAVREDFGAVCEVAGGRITLFESHFGHAEAFVAFGRRIGAGRAGDDPGRAATALETDRP